MGDMGCFHKGGKMYRSSFFFALALVVLFGLGWSGAIAVAMPDIVNANVGGWDSFNCDLEAEEASVPGAKDCNAAINGGFFGCGEQSAGILGGAELLFIRPFFANGHPAGSLFGYESAPRLWLGYQFASGLAIKAKYWEFDHRAGSEEEGTYQLESKVFDLELAETFQLGSCWQAALSGGWRHVDFAFRYEEEPDLETSQLASNGLTLAAELRRNLRGGFSLFGGFRAAWLFGDLSYQAPWLDTGRLDYNGATQTMTEAQLGVEWARRPDGRRCEILARAGVEAQWWDSFAADMDAAQIGMFGFFITGGIRH
jgi:hypothetical protein